MALLHGFLEFIRFLCYLFSALIIVRSILSWLSLKPTNILVIYLYRVTEPLLSPLRRIVPRAGMIDLSPVLAILLLYAIVLLTYIVPQIWL